MSSTSLMYLVTTVLLKQYLISSRPGKFHNNASLVINLKKGMPTNENRIRPILVKNIFFCEDSNDEFRKAEYQFSQPCLEIVCNQRRRRGKARAKPILCFSTL